ncbi:hypothetical protein M406DRAFT_100979 [Cryphonectria parasitica EP155]|uniref:Uncharacterized protein n=1 Tax=Cryphonectria parasitica (strain ATCC 38755 / EP155) TaxID=660469 RepID=A0A9P4YCU7_CRYP1|nr:uncharacterized protein M406DRAFT_100979 [Cryphonectria parasitica EP155]KAF3770738.1 hypothetical protein M406DRAFT_100979 [Cryphonectria parasitica EP155]
MPTTISKQDQKGKEKKEGRKQGKQRPVGLPFPSYKAKERFGVKEKTKGKKKPGHLGVQTVNAICYRGQESIRPFHHELTATNAPRRGLKHHRAPPCSPHSNFAKLHSPKPPLTALISSNLNKAPDALGKPRQLLEGLASLDRFVNP